MRPTGDGEGMPSPYNGCICRGGKSAARRKCVAFSDFPEGNNQFIAYGNVVLFQNHRAADLPPLRCFAVGRGLAPAEYPLPGRGCPRRGRERNAGGDLSDW